MNIFFDKSLPKRTQILLQSLRIVLLVMIFGGIFYASINPLAGDILLYSSIALAVIFLVTKKMIERRRKNLASEEQLNSAAAIQGSEPPVGGQAITKLSNEKKLVN